MMTNQSIL